MFLGALCSLYPACIRAFSTEACLSGYLLIKDERTEEDSHIFKKGTQLACEADEKCKMLVASSSTLGSQVFLSRILEFPFVTHSQVIQSPTAPGEASFSLPDPSF